MTILSQLLAELVSGELSTMGLTQADDTTQREAGALLSAWFEGQHSLPPCAMPLWLREAFEQQRKITQKS